MQYITVEDRVFIIPYGEIALVESQEVITLTIDTQNTHNTKKRDEVEDWWKATAGATAWRLLPASQWCTSRGPPVLKGCLARPEEDKSETYTGHSGDAKKK